MERGGGGQTKCSCIPNLCRQATQQIWMDLDQQFRGYHNRQRDEGDKKLGIRA